MTNPCLITRKITEGKHCDTWLHVKNDSIGLGPGPGPGPCHGSGPGTGAKFVPNLENPVLTHGAWGCPKNCISLQFQIIGVVRDNFII